MVGVGAGVSLTFYLCRVFDYLELTCTNNKARAMGSNQNHDQRTSKI